MQTKLGKFSVGAIAAAALFMSAGLAHGAATIINPANTVALGVKDTGALNTSVGSVAVNASGYTGLAYNFGGTVGWRDATAPGCLCEGWGVSATYSGTGYSGYDGTSNGFANLSTGVFSSTATTATANAFLTSLAGLKVQHAYSPADNAPSALFKSVVTITNDTDQAITDVRYVRVMDWDVPLTEFSEYVTIKGTGTTTLLEKSHLDGFASPDPLSTACDTTGCGYGGVDTDLTDAGPSDHGAYFRFNFGSLDAGESYSFTIFYGAAANESAAIAAIGAESIELYSLGQSNVGGPNNDGPTFIFGFAGVGGEPIEPEPIPEPISLSLVGLGLAAMGALRRRRRTV